MEPWTKKGAGVEPLLSRRTPSVRPVRGVYPTEPTVRAILFLEVKDDVDKLLVSVALSLLLLLIPYYPYYYLRRYVRRMFPLVV